MGRRSGNKPLKRKAATRKVGAKILIVCEDSKTAPNYLNAHIKSLKLPPSISARATGESDPTPNQVVKYALDWLETERQDSDFGKYDTAVFCVIDRDEHTTFDRALATIKAEAKKRRWTNKKVKIEIFPSYPCFEVWYLLHYKYTRQSFLRTGDNSPADMVIKELKKIPEFSAYSKGDANHFELLAASFATAMGNAKKSKTDADATGEPNSTTDIHLLMKYLQGLLPAPAPALNGVIKLPPSKV